MKLKYKYCLCGALLIFSCILIKNWYLIPKVSDSSIFNTKSDNFKKAQELERQITLIIRYNRESSERIASTVNSFLSVFPLLPIIIVSDSVVPKEIFSKFSNTSGIINIPLKLDLLNLIVDRNIANYVKTKYVFVAPSGVLSFLKPEGLKLIRILTESKNDLIAIPVKKENIECLKIELNLLQWSLFYKSRKNYSKCNSIAGEHGIFMSAGTLNKIGEPFLLPFPESFYIQSTSLNLNVKLCHSVLLKSKNNDKTNVNFKYNIQKQIMYKQLKIKKVVTQNGTVEWYGCTRKTSRCFSEVLNSVPDYLNQGRWTPPCCLKVLRETVHHVFKVLKKWNVTFWLEGGSLLGAVRTKDIIPWDYDVDIGIYLNDLDKCPWLRMVHLGKFQKNQLPAVIDDQGFVWERAAPHEGEFYRVQASIHNRLHVDIFPFYSKNGIMTKKTWFFTHPQDKEFPEYYLKPLTTIEFVGIEAPSPNNVKEFLELKFGKGCVENPQYPNSKLFPFPSKVRSLVINETYN